MVNQPDPRMAPSVQSQEAVNPGGEDAIGQDGWIYGESQQTYSVDSAGNQIGSLVAGYQNSIKI